jgi:histidine ammonia-lyase
MADIYTLTDKPITIEDFINVALHRCQVELDPSIRPLVEKNRHFVETLTENGTIAYGLNTGFGSLKDKIIAPEDIETLQLNLIRSHAVGTGDPVPPHIVRGMMFLRLVSFSKACSGVRYYVLEKLVECLNKNFIPMVPSQGSVGASGDLCPLSHMVLGMMGEGLALSNGEYIPAIEVLSQMQIEPLVLSSKEGLALNNGTQFITSNLSFATYHALRILNLSTLIAATSVEALHGTHRAFHPSIHEVRPHMGQIEVARLMRSYLEGSEIYPRWAADKIQDAYSLRCIPQIHGAAYDLVKYVESIVITEMNSVTDNPLVFTKTEDPMVISGGNFHGMPVAMAADSLALALSYLCNASERRIERMVNHSLNGFLPDFLVPDCGLNSGFMIVQYAAAGITAENRTLANPGSVHSIPTCNGTEDIVSMGAYPARKAIQSVENTYKVIGYELATACQALDYTEEKPGVHIRRLYERVKEVFPHVDKDRYMSAEINRVIDLLHTYN